MAAPWSCPSTDTVLAQAGELSDAWLATAFV